jgi:hypothetical protein
MERRLLTRASRLRIHAKPPKVRPGRQRIDHPILEDDRAARRAVRRTADGFNRQFEDNARFADIAQTSPDVDETALTSSRIARGVAGGKASR